MQCTFIIFIPECFPDSLPLPKFPPHLHVFSWPQSQQLSLIYPIHIFLRVGSPTEAWLIYQEPYSLRRLSIYLSKLLTMSGAHVLLPHYTLECGLIFFKQAQLVWVGESTSPVIFRRYSFTSVFSWSLAHMMLPPLLWWSMERRAI